MAAEWFNAMQMQQWMDAAGTGMQMPPMLPGSSPQTPVGPNCGTHAFGLPNCSSDQQAPMTSAGCPLGAPPVFAAGQQHALSSPIGNCLQIQEELMTALMPDAYCLDREQIAEQLRAAVPCCYDD